MAEEVKATPLKLLSNLGAISDPVTRSINIVEIKPFFDWTNTPLRNTILSMRLLNVGEVEDATLYCSQFPESVRKDKMDVETLTRSIFRFNGVPLVTEEELKAFNANANAELTELEYKRFRVREFEGIVRDRLATIYFALLQKQQRFLSGLVMDHITGAVRSRKTLTPGYLEIRFSHAEIIEKEMVDKLTPQDKKDLDELMDAKHIFEEEDKIATAVKSAEQKHALLTLDGTYKCRYCGVIKETEGEIIKHVENECERVNAPIEQGITTSSGESSFSGPGGPDSQPG